MIVRFWGTRGSIPVALTARDLRQKIEAAIGAAIDKGLRTRAEIATFLDHASGMPFSHTYGGHSPCVQIDDGENEFLVCDMGSGARPLGSHIMEICGNKPPLVNIVMSHVHWDHIMGFPFFAPAYMPGTIIRIHGCHSVLEQAFRLQQSPPCFPVEFSRLAASIEFVALQPGVANRVGRFAVTPRLQRHTGDSYGYRFERNGKVVVYSTDSEHRPEESGEMESFANFFHEADLLIFDAMYSLAEAASVKEDWGHSSNIVGVELAQMAKVKHLCMFHHEPAFDDQRIHSVLEDTIRFEELTRQGQALKITAAYDGMEIEV